MKEKDIERYLCQRAQARGGAAYKLILFTGAGFPDRTVLLPGGRIAFIECKAPGKKPTTLQTAWLTKLQCWGFRATWVDTLDSVEAVLNEIYPL